MERFVIIIAMHPILDVTAAVVDKIEIKPKSFLQALNFLQAFLNFTKKDSVIDVFL